MDELAEGSAGVFRVGKLNVDDNTAIAARYGVQSIPTVLFFKDGEVVEKIVGAQPKENVVARIEPHLPTA